jgi:hypothetical protein
MFPQRVLPLRRPHNHQLKNARLITETREALEQQTATAEVLGVINSSPGDLAPVFDAILEKATRVCEAVFGTLSIWDGERFHWVAFRGLPTELVEALQQQQLTPVGDRRPVADRIVRGEMVISMPDLREAEHRGVPVAQAFLRHGARSCVRLSPRDPQIGISYLQIGLVHLLQSRTDEAVPWLEKARNANPGLPIFRAWLASVYGLKGDTERAAAELAEARRLISDDRYLSLARLKAVGYFGAPKVRALCEATYFAGLRKAGMPEE